ncbi:hypothetical protein IFVP182_C190041 [Vibrio parahaemolyticus]
MLSGQIPQILLIFIIFEELHYFESNAIIGNIRFILQNFKKARQKPVCNF